LQDLADEITSGLRRLRESAPSERIATLQTFGRRVGEFDKALGRSIAAQGADVVFKPFHDAIMRETVQEIVELLNAR
jgi:hypothetical protein